MRLQPATAPLKDRNSKLPDIHPRRRACVRAATHSRAERVIARSRGDAIFRRD